MPIKNPWRGVAGLPAAVWIVFATTFVNRAGSMVLPFLALYGTRHLGVRPALAGLALTIYGVGGLVGAPLAGRLCDRIGAFAVLRGSLLVSGILLLTVPLAHQFETFLALTFVWAVVAEAVRPASLAALTSSVRPDQRKAAVAVNRLAINLGMSIGPMVGGFLAAVSYPLLFMVDGATAIVSSLVLAVLLIARPSAVPSVVRPTTEQTQNGRGSVLRDPLAVMFLFGVLLMAIVFYQHEGAMPIFLVRDLHYRESFYGVLFFVNTVLIVVAEVPINLAMSHWSHRWTLVLGATLFAIGFGSMAVVRSTTGLIAAAVVWTLGEMIALPSSGAYVLDIAPPGRSGQYVGAYSSTFSLALLIGPWAGTIALERFGGVALWVAAFVTGMISAGVLSTVGTTQSGASSNR
jgi:predicted MFS family arabinose efflux permease